MKNIYAFVLIVRDSSGARFFDSSVEQSVDRISLPSQINLKKFLF